MVHRSTKAASSVCVKDTAKKLGITERKLQGKISKYAKESYGEAFAEAFSSINGTNATKEATELMKIFEKKKNIFIKIRIFHKGEMKMIGCVFKKDSRGNYITDKDGNYIVDAEKDEYFFKEAHKETSETKKLIEEEMEYIKKMEEDYMKKERDKRS